MPPAERGEENGQRIRSSVAVPRKIVNGGGLTPYPLNGEEPRGLPDMPPAERGEENGQRIRSSVAVPRKIVNGGGLTPYPLAISQK